MPYRGLAGQVTPGDKGPRGGRRTGEERGESERRRGGCGLGRPGGGRRARAERSGWALATARLIPEQSPSDRPTIGSKIIPARSHIYNLTSIKP